MWRVNSHIAIIRLYGAGCVLYQNLQRRFSAIITTLPHSCDRLGMSALSPGFGIQVIFSGLEEYRVFRVTDTYECWSPLRVINKPTSMILTDLKGLLGAWSVSWNSSFRDDDCTRTTLNNFREIMFIWIGRKLLKRGQIGTVDKSPWRTWLDFKISLKKCIFDLDGECKFLIVLSHPNLITAR